MGMVLPVSTPPNALAHVTSRVTTGDMIKSGLVKGGLGLVVVAAVAMVGVGREGTPRAEPRA